MAIQMTDFNMTKSYATLHWYDVASLSLSCTSVQNTQVVEMTNQRI
jgi:hypothetical protein